jgi:hypothetical protein
MAAAYLISWDSIGSSAMSSWSMIVDFASALAVVIVLAFVYGRVRQWLAFPRTSQIFLGCFFGFAAVVQMSSPLVPMEGLVIDMRNIPIALCGAFLGWRASLTCLAIAAMTRIGIGGIGMWSGLLGMVFAMLGGRLWAIWTRRLESRNALHLFGLGVMGSAHLFAAPVLPEPAFTWFVTYAMLPIFLINMVVIPSVAALLEAEHRKISKENLLLAAVDRHPETGLMTAPAFERELTLRAKLGEDHVPKAMMVIRIRHMSVLASIMSDENHARLFGLLRLRLVHMRGDWDLMCSRGARTIVVALGEADMGNLGKLQRSVQAEISEEPIVFENGFSKTITVDTQIVPWSEMKSLDDVISPDRRPKRLTLDAALAEARKGFSLRRPKIIQTVSVRAIRAPEPETFDALFVKAAKLMSARP